MVKTKVPTVFEEKVYNACRKIPRGKVATYRSLAEYISSSPRAVGNALGKNPYAPEVPCHRVIRSNREIGGFMQSIKTSETNKKLELLNEEGIVIKDGKIIGESQIFKFL